MVASRCPEAFNRVARVRTSPAGGPQGLALPRTCRSVERLTPISPAQRALADQKQHSGLVAVRWPLLLASLVQLQKGSCLGSC